jgi:hypothetical protein
MGYVRKHDQTDEGVLLMLLVEVEEHVRKLPKSDLHQLMHDIQTWLHEAEQTDLAEKATVLERLLKESNYKGDVNWKLHPDFDWEAMDDAAERLRAIKATKSTPQRVDETKMEIVDV